MNRRKIGQLMFWIGVASLVSMYAFIWIGNQVYRTETVGELANTIWKGGGIFYLLRIFLTLIGILFSLLGLLIFTGSKKSFFWIWGIIPLICFVFLMFWFEYAYNPVIFGLGGAIITYAYASILLVWYKTHYTYDGIAKIGREIQLVGYTFFYITALFLCIYIGQPNLPGLADQPTPTAESIIVSFCFGWILIAVGKFLTRQI